VDGTLRISNGTLQAAELAANERIEQQRIAAAIALDRAASAPGAVEKIN
jgi:hypothetical protein